jgi:hypothetical protein
VRRPSIDSVLQFKVKGLYGVYRVPANAYKEDYWPAGNYGIVLIRDDGPALTLLVEDGGIVRIVYHMLPLEMALKQDVGEWLLPPPTASPMSNVLLTPIPASSLQVIRPDNATRIARVAQLGKGAITSYRDIRNPRSTSPSRQMVGSWPLVTEMARCFSPEPCERRLGAASCFSCRTISLK